MSKKKVMAAGAGSNFLKWLNEKLRQLGTDEHIFGSYIIGILGGEDNADEKTEALEGILSDIIDNNLNTIVREIIDKWIECHPKVEEKKISVTDDVDAQLAKILESKIVQNAVQRQYTAEERRIREQILAQYSQLSGGEDSTDGSCNEESQLDLVKNTNVHDVQQAMKERREQAKFESQKKRDKDKEDREKQKQLREEKKEKRKTLKGERRR